MKNKTLPALLLGILLILPALLQAQSNPDTTFSLLLRVKMAKAVSTGLFNPDSDVVYAVSEPGFGTLLLAAGANHTYDAVLSTGLDSGQTYSFRFRINDTIYETNSRSITANPGTTECSAWWNDDPLNLTTFNVDMTFMVAVNAFDPGKDSLDITGTMNNWQGSPLMQRVDTSYVYRLSLPLDAGVTYKYRYRVDRDTARVEFITGPPRYFRAPASFITLNHFFYDYNPGTVPMTFMCDMRYQEEIGSFDPATDYLDVAGNFNNGGAWDLLYLIDTDSIHRGTLFFDTAMIGTPLTFKFRINGDSLRAELPGQLPRSYTLHTPTLPDPNRFFCWFDDTNPNIPTPPWVTDLYIQGALISGSTVTGTYAYHNLNGIPEGNSLYKWYTADTIGAALVPIDSAWQVNYQIDSTLNIGQYLVFEVTPVAAYGDSTVGETQRIWSGWAVGGLGIGEPSPLKVRFYPIPVEDLLTIESGEQELFFYLLDPAGRILYTKILTSPGIYHENLGDLPRGAYLVVMKCGDRSAVRKLIRK